MTCFAATAFAVGLAFLAPASALAKGAAPATGGGGSHSNASRPAVHAGASRPAAAAQATSGAGTAAAGATPQQAARQQAREERIAAREEARAEKLAAREARSGTQASPPAQAPQSPPSPAATPVPDATDPVNPIVDQPRPQPRQAKQADPGQCQTLFSTCLRSATESQGDSTTCLQLRDDCLASQSSPDGSSGADPFVNGQLTAQTDPGQAATIQELQQENAILKQALDELEKKQNQKNDQLLDSFSSFVAAQPATTPGKGQKQGSTSASLWSQMLSYLSF